MSLPSSTRHLSPQDGQDILFCHSCSHEWYRSSDTSPPPSCQRCQHDIVEIVTRENDPRIFQQTINSMFSDTLFNLGGLGSAGPSPRMPPLQARQRDNDRDHYHDPARIQPNDDDNFGISFQDQLHQHFHQSMHANAHERAMLGHRFAAARDGLGRGHGHSHNEENHYDSDPEEADIEEHEYHAPNNLHIYRTITTNFRPSRQPPQTNQAQPGSDAGRRPGTTEPSDAESVIRTFTHLIQGFRDSQTGRSGTETLFNSGNSNRNGPPRASEPPRQRAANNSGFGATSFTIATGPLRPEQVEHAGFSTVLGNILGQVGPPDVEEQNPQAAGIFPPGFPSAMQHIILAVLSGRDASFQSGDAVHSDEALDRIITMLMETGQQSSGAPPASQNALDELERKQVDQDMLGSEGHAECTICISEVKLNEEVLQLPCKHWFHEDCVVMWLKQHNTCPVCRNPVVQKEGDNANQASQSTPRSATTTSESPNAGGGTNGGNLGRNTSGGSIWSQPNTGGNTNGNTNSLFGNPIPNLLPRGLFININRPGNFSGTAGNTDPAGANATANASGNLNSTASNSTGTSSSAAPNPYTPSLRQRETQRQQDMASQQERLNAIRSANGLPPTAPSAFANVNASVNANATSYRSPRVSERSAAAERERRRRDSHSPDPGHNIPSRRYNPSFPTEFDDWQASGSSLPRSLRNMPHDTRPRSAFWGALGGSNYGSSSSNHSPNSTYGAGPGSATSRNGDQSSWGDRRRFSIPRRGSIHSNYNGNSNDNGNGTGMDGVNESVNTPSFNRTSSSHSQHSMFSDPAPDAGISGRPYVAQIVDSPTSPTMSSFPGGFSAHLSGDGNDDVFIRDQVNTRSDARSGDTGSSSNRRNSNGNSFSNNNGNGNSNSGGGGGLFGFLRRR